MPAHKSEIHAFIMREIVSGALKPGDLLDEIAVAARFNVSKTPVREAILQLEASGIVAKRPRAGVYIAALTPDELIEMIELHSELEGAAAYHAARRASKDQLAALTRAEKAYAAGSGADGVDAYNLNLTFHLAVFACCNNLALQRNLDITGARLIAYFRAQEGLRTGEGRAVAEHADISKAISEGRADDARAAMRRHAEIASDTLLDVISRMKS